MIRRAVIVALMLAATARAEVYMISQHPSAWMSTAATSAPSGDPTLLENLCLWMKFASEETLGLDSSVYGQSLIVSNVVWTDGAGSFNGTNSGMVGSDAVFPTGATPRTASLWIKRHQHNAQRYAGFVQYGSNAIGRQMNVTMDTLSTSYPEKRSVVMISNYGNEGFATSTNIPEEWELWVVAITNSTKGFLSKNGGPREAYTLSGNTFDTIRKELNIGFSFNYAGSRVNSLIDDIRLYSNVLSTAQFTRYPEGRQ